MLDQINKIIGESEMETLAGFYTNVFYSCFANVYLSGFSQSANTYSLSKTARDGFVEVTTFIKSKSGALPSRPGDSNKFYDLLSIVGGHREKAKISPTIRFKVLPKDFLSVDRWLGSFSDLSIDIDAKAKFQSGKESEKSFSVKGLKIIESYQVENLSVAETASGSIVDVSSKLPAIFTVILSDWIVDAISKDFLRVSIMDKLLSRRELLPVIE